MNEADTRAELIDPQLKLAGWGEVAESRVGSEENIDEVLPSILEEVSTSESVQDSIISPISEDVSSTTTSIQLRFIACSPSPEYWPASILLSPLPHLLS